MQHTELLLDDLENLLLVKLLGQTLNSGQSLATIAFCCETSGQYVTPFKRRQVATAMERDDRKV